MYQAMFLSILLRHKQVIDSVQNVMAQEIVLNAMAKVGIIIHMQQVAMA